jgi:hypothetical protein
LSERPPTLGSRRPAATTTVTKKDEVTVPADAPQTARDRWRDAEGTRIALFSWVEQIAEHPEREALFSRLHQQGQVLGHGRDVLYVRFASERQLISVPPELLRVLSHEPNEHW